MNYIGLKKIDERTFENPFQENVQATGKLVDSDLFDISTGEIYNDFKQRILNTAVTLLKEWEKQIGEAVDWNDYCVYSGVAGYALLYFNLSKLLANEDYLQQSYFLAERCVTHLRGHTTSFLTGDGGPIALACVCSHVAKQYEKRDQLLSKLEGLYSKGEILKSETDDVLYGKAGCLYALLYVRSHIGHSCVSRDVIQTVVESIIASGLKVAAQEKAKGHHVPPLLFHWHEKFYLAAAHGAAGILYILLQAREFLDDDTLNNLIRPTLDFVFAMHLPSGNFPSSFTDGVDRLVQWCHGAPGIVHCLTKAAEVFSSELYLKEAEKCADVIWQRGLLTKGYALCHGVAGNGYAFLNLYRVTKNPLYLHRALKFAEFCADYGKHDCRIPDHPLSMFEGMAGTIHYLFDAIHPGSAKFPGYEV